MIGEIENAMLERVTAASKAGVIPYSYPTHQTWPKDFDAFLQSETVRYPAVWSAFAGVHRTMPVGRGKVHCHAAFGLVVAAQSARNEQARRHGGSPSEPGSYQLAQDAGRLLHGHTLGLPIDSLVLSSILPVEMPGDAKLRQVSMYAVTFETGFDLEATTGLSDIADFKTFHADWDPAPFGHVDPDDIPDPVTPPAGADQVELPQ